jgi:hypothetical protein
MLISFIRQVKFSYYIFLIKKKNMHQKVNQIRDSEWFIDFEMFYE